MRIGTQELIIILLIAAFVFGGAKVAGIGKALGKSVREFKEEVKGNESENKDEKKEDETGEGIG